MKHISIRVSGKVQGVFFRANTKTQADNFGLTGFVRNEPDGSVYIEAEGDEKSLTEFIEWCNVGPSFAKVDSCEVDDGELKNFSDFVIQR
jgi:acylphosphatase